MLANKLNDLYLMADNEGIKVLSNSFSTNKKACCTKHKETEYIIIDYGHIKDENEEAELMAEGIAHLKMGTLHYLSDYNNPLRRNNIMLAEARTKWEKVLLLGLVDKIKEFWQDFSISSEREICEELGIDFEFYQYIVETAQSKGLLND